MAKVNRKPIDKSNIEVYTYSDLLEWKYELHDRQVAWVTLTAEQASQLLQERQNPTNRHVTKRRVEARAKDMKDGNFCADNGTVIILNQAGLVVDGHHRLTAQIAANATITWLFLCGFSYQFGDRGDKRSVKDQWAMNGKKTNTTYLAALRQLLLDVMYGEGAPANTAVTDAAMLAFEEAHPRLCAWLNERAHEYRASLRSHQIAAAGAVYELGGGQKAAEVALKQMVNKSDAHLRRLLKEQAEETHPGAYGYRRMRRDLIEFFGIRKAFGSGNPGGPSSGVVAAPTTVQAPPVGIERTQAKTK